MNKKYIPIGFQCSVAEALLSNGLKQETLPFDWMLSTPEFVYKILHLLLVEDMILEDLVKNHFFKCDSKVRFIIPEHFVVDMNSSNLYNTQYGVIFPHDQYDEHNINKYIRRFDRLKSIIKDPNNHLQLVYITPSSDIEGHLFINDVKIFDSNKMYLILNDIYKLIKNININTNMLMVDSISASNKVMLDSSIYHILSEPKSLWVDQKPFNNNAIHSFHNYYNI